MYDVMDRETFTSSFGPQVDPVGSPAATLLTRRTWDIEGNLTQLERWVVPDDADVDTIRTKWRYDLANRRVAEEDGLGRVDSTAYDSASNVRAVVTRRGHTLSMTYDALNRLLTRTRNPPPMPLEQWRGPLRASASKSETLRRWPTGL